MEGFNILLLAVQATHASSMIGTCVEVVNDPRQEVDNRRLAREVLDDARASLTAAKRGLEDRGANVRQATAAILGLS